jgi:uncharacterized protein YjbI with pentapeptide repeats
VLGIFHWEGWTKLTALATAVAAVGALVYTGQAQRSTHEQFASQYDLTVQSQYTDRFGKAVELLGSPTVDVRLGGIHSLSRLGRDSAKDRETIIDILGSYTRIHGQAARVGTGLRCTPAAKSGAASSAATVATAATAAPFPVEPDVATAIATVGRLQALSVDKLGVQVPGLCLEGVNLNSGWFVDCGFAGASLRWAHLRSANLNRTDLRSADLSHAELAYAQMADAKLSNANLESADLGAAPLRNADLSGANLTGAKLTDPATGKRADLEGVNLRGANLTGVDLAGFDLSQTDLTGAIGYAP